MEPKIKTTSTKINLDFNPGLKAIIQKFHEKGIFCSISMGIKKPRTVTVSLQELECLYRASRIAKDTLVITDKKGR